MDFIQILISNFNGRVLKEPRGFMKILQFFFSICAFATTTSFWSTLKVSVKCDDKNNETASASVPLFYSFQLYELDVPVCSSEKSLYFGQDFSSDSRFFVAVGVLAFLFSIGALVFYLLYDKVYLQDVRIPTLDFLLHCVFSILFLAGSSAWANSLNGLKSATSLETIVAENPNTCSENRCEVIQAPDFAKLNVSVILGFLNLFLFGSNLWFIYKETIFFASKIDQQKTTPDVDPRTITPRV